MGKRYKAAEIVIKLTKNKLFKISLLILFLILFAYLPVFENHKIKKLSLFKNFSTVKTVEMDEFLGNGLILYTPKTGYSIWDTPLFPNTSTRIKELDYLVIILKMDSPLSPRKDSPYNFW